jgi:hypothetical protein
VFPKRLLESIRTNWRSGAAVGLALAHAIAFVLVIFSRPPLPLPSDEPCAPAAADESCLDWWDFWGFYVAGRYFHTEVDFRLLSLVDLPALVVTGAVESTFHIARIRFSKVAETYVWAGFWFALGTVQWWSFGVLINARRPNKRLQPAPSAVSSR